MTRPLTAVACLLTTLCAAGANAEATTSTKSLLDALRKAMLARPYASITSLHTAGSINVVGLRGSVQEWDEPRSARFTAYQDAGALTGSSGWDGKVAWNQDYAGLVTIDGGTAGRLLAIDQAYFDNLRYLGPDAGGATVIYAGRKSDAGKTYDVLAVTPPQGSEVDLWIDPRTHLIARQTGTIGIVTQTAVLSDYRRVEGITYPFATKSQDSEGNSSETTLATLEINGDVAERLRVPIQNVHDFSVAGNTTTVPIQIVNNHIYVPSIMLNGRGPYTFVLDSGGDYIVTPEVAAAMQAKVAGSAQISGVGAATEGVAFTHLDSIAVGGAVVHNQYTLVLPIATSFGVSEGMRIDGMIGYQFLARFLTTIDYANAKLTLAMPGAAPANLPGASAIGFYIDGTIPRIPIGINGVGTTAEVDTGNRAALDLSEPFLAAHPAIAALAKTAPGVTGFGVGGPAIARLGRIPELQIGPYQISNTIAGFSAQKKGSFASPYDPVNVGAGTLRRFDVTFDYAHQQLLLAKGADYDAPASYDRSGIFLIVENGAYTVLSVFPGTPAASGGLAKGDVILAINGAPASTNSLAGVRALLSQNAGTVVHLHVRGAQGAERDVTLTLADYV